MTEILNNSFFYRLIIFFIFCFKKSFCYSLIVFFIDCYKKSFTYSFFCNIIDNIVKWYKFSFINKCWTHLVESEPAYLNSFCYKIICFCFVKLSAIADFIYKPLANVLDSSYFNRVMLNSNKLIFVLGAYVLCDHFFRGYFTSYGYLWDKLLFAGLALVSLYQWFVNTERKNIKMTPLDFSLVAFYVVCIFIFIVNNPDTKISLEGMRAVVQYTLWYFIAAWTLKSCHDVKIILLVIVAVGAVLGLHGVYQYIANVPMPANWLDSVEYGIRTRVYSVVGSPNILGCLMTLFIPISVSFAIAEKKIGHKYIFAFVSLIMLACLIFTSSRGAWIGFAAAAVIYVFLKDKRLIVPTCVMLLLVVLLVPSVSSRIAYMLTSEYTNSSLRGGRLARWLNGLIIISNYPFFGLGFGQFGGAVAMNNNIKGTFYMDNYYLKTAVEMGLVGLTAFILLMFSVLKWSYKTFVGLTNEYYKELSIGVLSGMIGVVVHNFFENIFEVPYMVGYFWILAAAVMILRRESSDKEKSL